MRSDSLAAVVDLKRPIQQWTRGWMLTKATDDKGVELGLESGRQFWICGRLRVSSATVTRRSRQPRLAFLDPDEVRRDRESLPPHLPPRAVAAGICRPHLRMGRARAAAVRRSDAPLPRGPVAPSDRRCAVLFARRALRRMACHAQAAEPRRGGRAQHARAAGDAWSRTHRGVERRWHQPAPGCAACSPASVRSGVG